VRTITTCVSALILVASLAGCGAQGLGSAASVSPQVASGLEIDSATGLRKAFTRIHKAIFNTMDKDKNGWLDEAEVGGRMTLRQFQSADKSQGWGSANRLSQSEFVNWATTTFLWFRQDADSFANTFRQGLSGVFRRLDENRDGLLTPKTELSSRDLSKLRLRFEYSKLKINVPIRKVPADKVAGVDKTGDGKLSQAEFEDLYLEMVIAALGGETAAPPAPPAPPAPAAPGAPVEPAPAEPADPGAGI